MIESRRQCKVLCKGSLYSRRQSQVQIQYFVEFLLKICRKIESVEDRRHGTDSISSVLGDFEKGPNTKIRSDYYMVDGW